MTMYKELEKYYEQNGHSNVKRNDVHLGQFCYRMRIMRQRGRLSKRKVAMLDKLEFPWVGERFQRWLDHYEKVKEFKEKHGHLDLSAISDSKIRKWITLQRHRKKRKLLPERCVKLLNKIDFQWVLDENKLRTWEEHFADVLRLKNEFGNARDFKYTHKEAGRWLDQQRRLARKGGRSTEKRFCKYPLCVNLLNEGTDGIMHGYVVVLLENC